MCVILLKREIVEMDLCVERMPFVLMLCMSGMKNADSVSSFFGTAAVR